MPPQSEQPSAVVRRLLTAVLRAPESAVSLSASELGLTLRLARRVRLLGHIGSRLQGRQLLDALPEAAREQLTSALVVVQARSRVTQWELNRLAWAFRDRPQMRAVVLKGCAYLLAKLPNAVGRVFADVDLLFDERELDDAERLLVERGWRGTKLEPYDQHYYRAWTHELPPLVHPEREVEADLHHNILPRTARLKPSGARLLANARPIEGGPFLRLADCDLVLHAMTHLMFDSDMTDCLRDLVDIDVLLRHFSSDDARFWETLWSRAIELDLARPAFYSLRYAHDLLSTPVPEPVLRRSQDGAPPGVIVRLMDRLVPRALFPVHPDVPSRAAVVARFLLYLRSLWIRMPPLLLARHLLYKFYVRRIRRAPPAAPETQQEGQPAP